ncbi:MAG: hypothetical protein ACOYD0_12435 [Candidatus Nanopelagicales bacterium]
MTDRKRSRVFAAVAVPAVCAVALVGCSQVAALKQVSGVPITTLQIATNNVLVSQNVRVKEAPVCEANAAGDGYECNGSTITGAPIVVTAPEALDVSMTPTVNGTPVAMPAGTLAMPMTITVAGKVIFKGDAQAVIEKNQKGS